ncbi:MAG: hypothetical protein KF862_00280 [Chitinophagaceae bacterium]|nr:hypothetical protein [Chitinophagaceae bacterium]
MRKATNILPAIVKYTLIVMAIFAVTQYVIAASGIRVRSGGDDKGKSDNTSGNFSNLKSTVTFSIKDNYRINAGNAFLNSHKTAENFKAQNSVVTYKKGNVVYLLPYKTQSAIKLPGFIKAAPCQSTTANR